MFGGLSLGHLIIILVVVMLIFGTKKLRTIGEDLGGAVKGFRKAMSDAETKEDEPKRLAQERDAEFPESHGGSAESVGKKTG
jgi:sec-independent protein translocase protein TatA